MVGHETYVSREAGKSIMRLGKVVEAAPYDERIAYLTRNS